MKNLIKKILKEEQTKLSLFDNKQNKYEKCSYYKNEPKYENLCLQLNGLGKFLYDDLGLKSIINKKIELMGQVRDLNDLYQEPLELLYKTGKFNQIKKQGGKFYLHRLSDRTTVYDETGEWSFVNKLNTNYTDLAELLTELFIRGNVVDKLTNKNSLGLKNYLISIKDKLLRVLDKYFKLDDYREFIRNTKHLSDIGEKAEEDVKIVLEKFGMTTLYQGGHGDFIDMIFGTDLIMGYGGKIVLIQVKSTEGQMLYSSKEERYKNIDYFAAPTTFGIIIKNKDGIITKLDKEGLVINDPKEENT
jgi:Holliday junction resolvase